MNKTLLAVLLVMALLESSLFATDTPTVELSVSKQKIILSEPMKLSLVISNPTRLELVVSCGIPSELIGGILQVSGPDPDAPFRRFVGGSGTPAEPGFLGAGEHSTSIAYVYWKGLRGKGTTEWTEVFPVSGTYRIQCEIGFADAEKWRKGTAVGERVQSNTVEVQVTIPEGVDAEAREYLRSHEIEAYLTEQCLKATQRKPDFSVIEDFLARFPRSAYSAYARSTLGWLYYGESRAWTYAQPSRQPEERDRQWARKAIPLLRQCSEDGAFPGRDDAKYWLGLTIYEADYSKIDEAGQLLQQAADSGNCRHETDAKKKIKTWKEVRQMK